MIRHKVLIPIDGSAASRRIVNVVRNYLTPAEHDLVLLRVALPPLMLQLAPVRQRALAADAGQVVYDAQTSELEPNYVWSAQEQAGYAAQLKAELEAEADPLRQAGYRVTTAVRFGEPAQQIADYVNDEAIGLVAMTTHGRTGLGRLVLGSVAESVLRHVNVPVLMVRTASA
jgi:nucleotide-binding universal stress UspA family protein